MRLATCICGLIPSRLSICWGPAEFDPIAFWGRAGALFPARRKGTVMKIPVETKPVLWGVVGGAIALAIVGFKWGGWVTGGAAEADATQRTNAAVALS